MIGPAPSAIIINDRCPAPQTARRTGVGGTLTDGVSGTLRLADMTWLITGGAGYIGAHVARAMVAAGERVVVLDDRSSGIVERLPDAVTLVEGRIADRALLDRVLAEHAVSGVVHLAAKKQVGESVEQPLLYYRENVAGLGVLLEAVVAAGVRRFLFSSSAAVYGVPDADLITEETPCLPINPYGETKLAGEWLVRAAGKAHGISTACLRYFNVAGAAGPELADTGVFNIVPMVFDRLTRGEAPGSSAPTTRRPTAPASATTSMWRTWPRPTSPWRGSWPGRTAAI